jgi:putative phosphoribosyl transferase
MRFQKYETRFQAGEFLAKYIEDNEHHLSDLILKNPFKYFCYAIPNGGVPVTDGFCTHFNLKFDILIVRKINIPYNTEAGFGSVTTDGSVLINQSLLSQLNLSEKAISDSIELTKTEIRDRLQFYNKDIKLEGFYEEHIKQKGIFILDDGLASGFTMLAAIKMIKKYSPDKIYVAVPTAPLRTVRIIPLEVDKIFCPNIREVTWFAVADAYRNWYDLTEAEVQKILTASKFYIK